jgi:membrane peptidoglycan carboxypeptidase
LSLTLGGGEVRLLDLAAAYGVLANGGKYVAPVSILEVKDTQGKVLDAYAGPRPQPATDPARAYLITSILSDNEARTPGFGPNSPLKLSRPAAVKTGTTDDFKDNWTVGYTSQLVAGVWVGNADNTPMRGTTGLTGAAPIWHDFMEYALKPLPVDPLAPPPGLEKAAVGRESGRLWVEGCPEPKVEDLFPVGALPTDKCEAPTPTPTYTPRPATSTPVASATPQRSERSDRQETPPTADNLRASLAQTATAAAAEAATRVARSRPPGRAATQAPTARPSAQPRGEATRPPAAPTAAAAATTRPAGPTAAPTRANLLEALRATVEARREDRGRGRD